MAQLGIVMHFDNDDYFLYYNDTDEFEARLLLDKPAATAVDPAAAATAPSLRFVAPVLLLVVASAAIILSLTSSFPHPP